MLTITVPGTDSYDELKQEFVNSDDFVLELEHSLASLSKWEQMFGKPFLSKESKTTEETIGYVKAMTLTKGVPDEVFMRLTQGNFASINAYLDQKMTATTFNEMGTQNQNQEVVTAEIIYYWMFTLGVPLEAENWHFNKLIATIKVINLKNTPPKKMGRNEMLAQRNALNAERRRRYGTSG